MAGEIKFNDNPTTTIYLFNYSTMKLCSLTVHNWNGFMIKAKNVDYLTLVGSWHKL